MEIYKSETYKGCVIDIAYDTTPESPRCWSNLGTMYTAHKRYSFEEEMSEDMYMGIFNADRSFRKSFKKHNIALPIYGYEHGGITISTSPFACSWDSGLLGIISVEKDAVRKEYGWKRLTKARVKQIEEILQAEIDQMDLYCKGEVYGYQITCPLENINNLNPSIDPDDIADSCWGYYGDDGIKQAMDEAKSIIDTLIK